MKNLVLLSLLVGMSALAGPRVREAREKRINNQQNRIEKRVEHIEDKRADRHEAIDNNDHITDAQKYRRHRRVDRKLDRREARLKNRDKRLERREDRLENRDNQGSTPPADAAPVDPAAPPVEAPAGNVEPGSPGN